MGVLVKTQYGVPSRVNAVYPINIDRTNVHHQLSFDGASDVVDEEDQEAEPTLISVV